MANVSVNQIRLWQKIYLAVFALILISGVFLINGSKAVDLTLSYLARDELSGNLISASRTVWEAPLRMLFVIWAAIEVLLAAVTSLKPKLLDFALQTKVNRWRWLFAGISAFFLIGLVGALGGARDIITLKLLAIFAFLGGFMGWLSDRVQTLDKKNHWLIFSTHTLCGLLPWAGLIVVSILTVAYGMVGNPMYVYLILAIGLTSAALTHLNQAMQMKARSQNQLEIERNHLLISLVSKTLIALTLIISLKG